jgi:hypothetical protein
VVAERVVGQRVGGQAHAVGQRDRDRDAARAQGEREEQAAGEVERLRQEEGRGGEVLQRRVQPRQACAAGAGIVGGG